MIRKEGKRKGGKSALKMENGPRGETGTHSLNVSCQTGSSGQSRSVSGSPNQILQFPTVSEQRINNWHLNLGWRATISCRVNFLVCHVVQRTKIVVSAATLK